jgi:DNA-binding NarL/FixJ family response regulator
MEKRVYILGEHNLHNELLSYVVKEKLGYICSIFETVDDILVEENEDINYISLMLIDSKVISFEDALRTVVVKSKNPKNIYLLALFNIERDSGIEAKALQKKIRGFFYSHDSLELLIRGIKTMFKGEIWISREILLKCTLDGFKQKKSIIMEKTELTKREIEILSMISLGASNEDISKKTCISTNTVKTHLYNIFKKIKVTNRLQAAIWAARNL